METSRDDSNFLDLNSEKAQDSIARTVAKAVRANIDVVKKHLKELNYQDLIEQYHHDEDITKLLSAIEVRLASSVLSNSSWRVFKAYVCSAMPRDKKVQMFKNLLCGNFFILALLPLRGYTALMNLSKGLPLIALFILTIILPTLLSRATSDLIALSGLLISLWVWLSASVFSALLVSKINCGAGKVTAGNLADRFRNTTSFPLAVSVVIICIVVIASSYAVFYTILDSRCLGYHFHLTARGHYPYTSFLYFSIMTLTTIGYGDITPLSTIARFICCIEVLQGVTLFGVILSAVVGVYNNAHPAEK